MKKILTLLVFCLMVTTGIKAQYIDSDTRGWRLGWGVQLGMSKVTKCEAKNAFSWGINVSPEYLFGLGYVQSGVLFNSIGMKDMGNGAIDGTLSAYYVEVPLNIGLHVSISDNACWLIQAGPYAAYGFTGSKIDWGEYKTKYFDDAKRWDFGLNARTGIELNSNIFSLGIQYGFSDVFQGGGRNLAFNFNWSYFFSFGGDDNVFTW